MFRTNLGTGTVYREKDEIWSDYLVSVLFLPSFRFVYHVFSALSYLLFFSSFCFVRLLIFLPFVTFLSLVLSLLSIAFELVRFFLTPFHPFLIISSLSIVFVPFLASLLRYLFLIPFLIFVLFTFFQFCVLLYPTLLFSFSLLLPFSFFPWWGSFREEGRGK